MTLQGFRIDLELSQDQMAKEIGVCKSYYSKIESGFQNPSFEFLKKLKMRFPKVNIDEMFFKNKTSKEAQSLMTFV